MGKGKHKKRVAETGVKLQTRAEKTLELAQRILTDTIAPAGLLLEDTVEALAQVLKALVLSNSSDEDPEDRSSLIDTIEGHVLEVLDDIDPAVLEPTERPPHFWIVPPQGIITETIGILWDGCYGDETSGVRVVTGEELATTRAECLKVQHETGMVIVEGIEGLAIVDPDWDGEDTAACSNPACGKHHNVHLMVAEHLFLETAGQPSVSN
jgi:hypothetical protein